MRRSTRRSGFRDAEISYAGSNDSNHELDDFSNSGIVNSSTNKSFDPLDDEDHDEEAINPRLRSRQPVNYNSTKYIVDEEDEIPVSRRKARTQKRGKTESEDGSASFDEDHYSSSVQEPSDKEDEFQITSDYSDEDDFGYKRKRKPMKNSRAERYKKHRALKNFIDDDEEEEEEEDSLLDDLHDLEQDNAAFNSSKRHLRERSTKVNYELPHPDSDIIVFNKFNKNLEEESESRQTRGNKTGGLKKRPEVRANLFSTNDYPLKRLYQTSGPFGGNNVMSLINKFDHSKKEEFKQQLESEVITKKESLKTKIVKADLSQPLLLPPTHAKNKNHKYTPSLNGVDSDSSSSSSDEQITADTDPIQIPKETSFNDIGGLDNYITQLKEMITLPLLYPELYTNFNIQPPRGVLFHGPPGTGKTLMARALAAQSSKDSNTKITFYMRKGSDILSKWVGEAERQLRLLFEQAASTQPSIIFFDELDGLAPVRSSKQEQIHSSIVSTLLALMDGMDSRGQVVVIGATNRPDSLDPALRRGGRFDREFYFGLPAKAARLKILKIHTKGWKNIDNDVLEDVSDLTNGFGGADLKQLCVEAALGAVMRTFPQIYGTVGNENKLRNGGKYKVDVEKVTVTSGDFNRALEKVNPSSSRHGGTTRYEKLPPALEPLLKKQELTAIAKFNDMFPIYENNEKEFSLIDHYLQNEIKNTSFKEFQFMKNLSNSRFNKPKLFITGSGAEYIANSLLHRMDNVNIQSLDISYLHSDIGRSIDSAIVSAFNEAKRRQPAIIYVPDADIWSTTIGPSLSTFEAMFKRIKHDDKILVLFCNESVPADLKHLFRNSSSIFNVKQPTELQLKEFFVANLKDFLMSPASRFESFKKRTKNLPALPIVEEQPNENEIDESNGDEIDKLLPMRRYLDSYKKIDMKLKNKLKVKLAGLMDLLKVRYKKFKKPLVDDDCLVCLFETSQYHTPVYQLQDKLVKDTTSDVCFSNMDLDTIEERLWNGFYSEPKEFFKDILLIYDDSIVSKVRERIISASEMVANCDVFIDEMLTANETHLSQEWKNCKKRDDLREKLKIVDGIDVFPIDTDTPEPGPAQEAKALDATENEAQTPLTTEKVVLENPVNEPEKTSDSLVAPVSQSQVNDVSVVEDVKDTSVVDEEERESESVLIDVAELESCIADLVTAAETMSVDDIQHVVSDIVAHLWPYRLQNNKRDALNKLREYIDNI